jgi:Domain of unknown function (DUF5050)
MFLTNVWNRVLGRWALSPTVHALEALRPQIYGWAVLGLFLGAMSQARSDYIYWSSLNGGDIRRANLDGTGQTTLVSGQRGPLGPALDLAGGQMYWGDNFSGDIRRANLDGSGQTILITGLNSPGAPALDLANGQMYWNLNNTPGNIMRANLDGTGLTTLLGGLSDPNSVALDLAGGKIYWADNGSGSLRRANLDGSGLTTLVTGLFGRNNRVALDLLGGRMYWTNTAANGDIRRANLDGSGQEILVQNLNAPGGIALDVSHGLMYWSDIDGGDIRRANLDGSGQEILITGLNGPGIGPGTVALDLGVPGTAVFFAVSAPSSVSSGAPFDVTITALDPYGSTAVNYEGTVTFSTSDTDPGVVLPPDYTFTAADAGVHTFTGGVNLITPGDQTVTATDTASGITRTVTVTVVPPG